MSGRPIEPAGGGESKLGDIVDLISQECEGLLRWEIYCVVDEDYVMLAN